MSSGLPENALDLTDSRVIDLGDFGSRHAVFHPGPDPRELCPRDRASDPRRGLGRRLDYLVNDRRCRRDYPQHTRLPRWLLGPRERFRTGRRGDWGFRGKQRFRRLARSADSFAVVAARVGLSLLTKQDLLRSDRYAISKWELVNVHKLHLDGRGPIRKCVLAEMRFLEN